MVLSPRTGAMSTGEGFSAGVTALDGQVVVYKALRRPGVFSVYEYDINAHTTKPIVKFHEGGGARLAGGRRRDYLLA